MYYANGMKRLLKMHGIDGEVLDQIVAKGFDELATFDEGRGELGAQEAEGLAPHGKEGLQGGVESDAFTINAWIWLGSCSPCFIRSA